MTSIVAISLGIMGAILGSFAAASVWRLRFRQLSVDKKSGEKLSKQEGNELEKLKIIHAPIKKDRSKCLSCGVLLCWFELIPLLSWLMQMGKCRSCKKKIGSFEFFAEIFLATYFVGSFLLWPSGVTDAVSALQLGLWLIAGVLFTILMGYDKKWFLLPNAINYTLIGVGAIYAGVTILHSNMIIADITSLFWSVFIMSGMYLLLYLYSKGKWIGFGDIKLGLGLALFLGDWRFAALALFMANFIGCVLVIPALMLKKIARNTHIPFGPFLIVGTIIAVLFGEMLIRQYAALII